MDWFDLVLIGMSIGVAVLGTAMIKFFGSDLVARTIWRSLGFVGYPRGLRVMHISAVIIASVFFLVAPFLRK